MLKDLLGLVTPVCMCGFLYYADHLASLGSRRQLLTSFSHTDLKNKEAVLHSSPRSPKVCIFCMSLFVSTPDSDNQLIRSELLAIDMVPTQCSLLPTP